MSDAAAAPCSLVVTVLLARSFFEADGLLEDEVVLSSPPESHFATVFQLCYRTRVNAADELVGFTTTSAMGAVTQTTVAMGYSARPPSPPRSSLDTRLGEARLASSLLASLRSSPLASRSRRRGAASTLRAALRRTP